MKISLIRKIMLYFGLIVLIAGCGGGSGSNNSPNPTPQTFSLTSPNPKAIYMNINWYIDGESQPALNLRDSGWHVLTATVTAVSGTTPSEPVEGIQTEIENSSESGLVISTQDINCQNAVFSKVGDSCSIYFRLSYPTNPNQDSYLASVFFYPGNYPTIPSSTIVTDKIAPTYSITDYRVVLPIESQYYQASNLQANPNAYQIVSVSNGLFTPVNLTSITPPSNPNFSIVNRTTNGSNDPYYGAYSQCALTTNPSLNQVSQLANNTESCIIIYQANESAVVTQESSSTLITTDSGPDMLFPYNGGSYTLQTNYTESGEGTTSNIITWESFALPTNQYWTSVTYGNNEFVAVSSFYSDIGAVSSDGIHWTQTTLPSAQWWDSVTYGNGVFVAFGGDSNIAAISSDGIHWTQTTLPSSQEWTSVTYGNGLLVAISGNYNGSNIAAISSDGIHWAQTTLPSFQDWDSVTYGNGVFVAVSDVSNIAAISSDGIHWTQTTLPSVQAWTSVTYGNGLFVAISLGSAIGAVSSDGIHWKQTTLPSFQDWAAVTYGNGVFVAISDSDSDIGAVSSDGVNWTQTILPSVQDWNSVTYGNGKFVVIAEVSNVVAVGQPYSMLSNFIMYTTPPN